MKVALISHEGGGISSVTRALAQSLARKKINTTIFTGTSVYPQHTKNLNEYLDVTYLPIPNLPPRHIWFQALNFNKLLKFFKGYSIIHGMSPNASVGFTFFRKKLSKPFVATLHTDPRTNQKAFFNQPTSSWTLRDLGYFLFEFPMYDLTLRAILARSDYVTMCSYSLLDQLNVYANLDANKVSVIHNGIDLKEIENVQPTFIDSEGDISIIFAGRLYYLKGAMLLLKAFNTIKNLNRNVTIKIFGKGPIEHLIKKYVVDSGLKDQVSVLGHIPHKKLIGEIKKSHIVAFPSLSEAQSMFMLEAMACKKPVLAFDLPFASEIITNMETGILSKAGDIEALSRNLQLLISDEKLRRKLGLAAYEYVKLTHNLDLQAEKYLDVYKTVISCSK